uniref:POLO box domain-containing protein n=1 Tax=Globisporangium ultimum (strain ATCC 200006 / CBS 805.95 / DAOM BR144) TaxID=431595 RepID=K3X142_GLOUD
MGYMLSNGCSGVYFNDSTKAIASPDDQFFEYLERTSDAANAAEHRVRYAVGKHDPSLAKKVTLLKHFKSYLVDGRAESEEAELLEAQLAQLPQSRTDRVDAQMEFVKKWVKTRHAVLFCLSNDTFQINFFDSSKLVISQEGRVVTYLDKDGELAVFASALVILKNERPDLLKRLRYSKDMLQQMVKVYATDRE